MGSSKSTKFGPWTENTIFGDISVSLEKLPLSKIAGIYLL
jgi:hypothetical protein